MGDSCAVYDSCPKCDTAHDSIQGCPKTVKVLINIKEKK